MSSNRYSNPLGYNQSALSVIRGATKYTPNNGYKGAPYSPNAPSSQSVAIDFSAAPANGSTIGVPDVDVNGVPFTAFFTFTYSGAPGFGIIPLVAGGGSAAQCAAATALAFNSQLNSWASSNPFGARVFMVNDSPGRNVSIPFAGTQTTGAFGKTDSILGNALPASIGGRLAQLPYLSL